MKAPMVTGEVQFDAAPAPLTGTDCGLPEALSVKTMLDALLPAELGLNTTDAVQVPPEGATLAQPVAVGTKSVAFVPLETMDVMVSAAVPLLVMVKVCGAEDVPTVVEAKVRLVGATAKLAACVPTPPRTPVPVSWSAFGEMFPLVESETLAVEMPAAEGAKLKLRFTDCPLGTVKGKAGPA
jgi:hypothetical protein